MSNDSRILPGCSVLPPMERAKPKVIASSQAKSKAVGQRFKVLNNFIDFTLRGLPRGSIAVWLVLYRDSKEDIAQTSQADIARRAGVCERHVRRVIDRLVRLGLVVLVRRGSLRHGPSKYRVTPLTMDSCRRT